MNDTRRLTGRVIAAARALVGVGEADFAAASGISVAALRHIEASGSSWLRSDEDIDAMCRGLDHFGALVIDESDGMGAGVRLRFTRQDVKQIARLEGEGGIVGADDAP